MKILFEKGCSLIAGEDIAFLKSIARNLRLYEKFRVTVIGHLSKEELVVMSTSLSKKRTHAVAQVLRDLGIPTSWVDCEIWKSGSSEMDYVQLFVFKP